MRPCNVMRNIKGQFIKGHSISKGKNHGNWLGDNVGYKALHARLRRNLIKPEKCKCCGSSKLLELSNISGSYFTIEHDYEWLCRKCHMTKDGRLKNFKKTSYKKGKTDDKTNV